MCDVDDRRSVASWVVGIAVASLAAVGVAPALRHALPSSPGISTGWWVVLGAAVAATVVFQGAAFLIARGGASAIALVISLGVASGVVHVTAGLTSVNGTLLLLGAALIGQQIGRVPGRILAAQAIGLMALLLLREHRFAGMAGPERAVGLGRPLLEPLVMDYLLVGVAAVTSWLVWADDQRLHRLAGELRGSRLRLVESADAVRRGLERDLHDGAQQRIVAAAINVSTARRLVAGHGERVEAILDASVRDLHAAAAQLRDLSHGVYPAELTRAGLEVALRGLADHSSRPLAVTVSRLGRRSRDVEAAVYFCCAEAVQNAVKHAGPEARVRIDVDGTGGAVVVTVSDDGAGFDTCAVADGHGLVNMEDRIGAVGGTLTVHTSPGHGTTIRADIPPTEVRPVAYELGPTPLGVIALAPGRGT